MKVVYCLSLLAAAGSAMPLSRRDFLAIDIEVCLKLFSLQVAEVDYGQGQCLTKYTKENPYKADKDTCSKIRALGVDPSDLYVVCNSSANKRSEHVTSAGVHHIVDYSSGLNYGNIDEYRANGPENLGSYGSNGPEHGNYGNGPENESYGNGSEHLNDGEYHDNGPEHSNDGPEHSSYGGNGPEYLNNSGYNAHLAPNVAPEHEHNKYKAYPALIVAPEHKYNGDYEAGHIMQH